MTKPECPREFWITIGKRGSHRISYKEPDFKTPYGNEYVHVREVIDQPATPDRDAMIEEAAWDNQTKHGGPNVFGLADRDIHYFKTGAKWAFAKCDFEIMQKSVLIKDLINEVDALGVIQVTKSREKQAIEYFDKLQGATTSDEEAFVAGWIAALAQADAEVRENELNIRKSLLSRIEFLEKQLATNVRQKAKVE